jgi:hypothetical protein
MSLQKQRMYKRIWWTCFARDRMTAVGYGRPLGINLEDVDVGIISETDFIDEGSETVEECLTYSPVVVEYFINHTKLCQLMGLVLSSMYSPARFQTGSNVSLSDADTELANWMFHLPEGMKYSEENSGDPMREYWMRVLHIEYYTVLCLLHRPYTWKGVLPPSSTAMYQSRHIGLTASNMAIRMLDDLMRARTLIKCYSFS